MARYRTSRSAWVPALMLALLLGSNAVAAARPAQPKTVV